MKKCYHTLAKIVLGEKDQGWLSVELQVADISGLSMFLIRNQTAFLLSQPTN
ncbi:MAG: hypothetical protein HZA13_06770 [Nitrospirae bacterium]|nr:hypothetical protein [Nitrospirota bacterium]